MSDKSFQAIWDSAKKLDADLSGISWSGFNIAGDEKSIKEVRRLMELEVKLRWLEHHHRDCANPKPGYGRVVIPLNASAAVERYLGTFLRSIALQLPNSALSDNMRRAAELMVRELTQTAQ